MSSRISPNMLYRKMTNLFNKYGLSLEDAELAAKSLICAEMAGISSHGIKMLPAHLEKCKNGYNTEANLITVKETTAFTVFNADNAVGMVSAWKCIQYAVNKSKENGIYTVFCNNANTFSAAYCYAKYAVENKKIALILCNSPAQMAPLGGKEKLLGTNPLAIGIPAGSTAPFILDMATSAVAKSKINMALRNGDNKIPYGWATDSEGIPTDDPKTAVSGLILPMSGAKGYGLSMAIDIISGLLCKSEYLNNVGRFYSVDNKCMNVGHTFVVIDPIVIYGDDFFEHMDNYLEKVRNSESVSGDKILIPGDLNEKYYFDCIKNGIPLEDSVESELNSLLSNFGESLN